jgi:Protein of unknown function (DUF1631)
LEVVIIIVDKLNKELSSIRALCQQLRVPELKYLTDYGETRGTGLSTESLEANFYLDHKDYKSSLLGHFESSVGDVQRAQVNNLAFLLDRAFDVWLRKNKLPNEINEVLGKWRFAIFRFLLFEFKFIESGRDGWRELLSRIFGLLERVCSDAVGWSPIPERSKHLLLNELDCLTEGILRKDPDINQIDLLLLKWQDYHYKYDQKFEKVSHRLVESESTLCWKRFSFWCAQGYIDLLFNNRKLPESLQCFLDSYWVNVVAVNLSCHEQKHISLDKDVAKLSHSLMKVFCLQGKQVFEVAESLLDDLQAQLKKSGIAYEQGLISALEASLVSLLKQEFDSSFVNYSSIASDVLIQQQFSHFDIASLHKSQSLDGGRNKPLTTGLELGAWYQLTDSSGQVNAMVLLAHFEYAGLLLFSNYLGMKAALYTEVEYQDLLQSGQLKTIQYGNTLADVFSGAIKGLLRVADSQQKARIAAAEKAKAEAERLLAQKQKAEQDAAQRAEDIAKRTQDILKKREDKKRSVKEASSLLLVQGLNIGAWVSITIDGEPERYKLVVKLAASGKYIFVDKLGIKKREYKEAELVERLSDNEIELLSDGAEFEDSLQRVVSRLRMAK